MKYSNNINSKYFIINLKVLELDYKFTYNEFNDILIDWIEESLITKYNKKLNWNISIIYPSEFYLFSTNYKNTLNKNSLLETKIIKLIIYLDNKIYPSFNINKLLYTNEYSINYSDFLLKNTNVYGEFDINKSTNITDIIISNKKITEVFDLNTQLITCNIPKFIDSISFSGVDKHTILHELDILKLGNKFTNTNYLNEFIYLKNIQVLGNNNLIYCNDSFTNFYDNLIYNN